MTIAPHEWRRAMHLAGGPSITSRLGSWYRSVQFVDALRGAALTPWTHRWMQSRAWLGRQKAPLGLFFRVTVSALLTFELAHWLNFQVPVCAVLTAIIVTQISVGGSLQTSLDYLAGTIGGAIYGTAVGVLVGDESEFRVLAGLAVAVGPLVLIATTRKNMMAAPITATFVLLTSTLTHASPIGAAVDRVFEVALGALVGVTISFVLFPSSAYDLASEAAARTLERLADAAGELMSGLKQGLGADEHHRIQEGIGDAVMQLNLVGAEAERERVVGLSPAPEPGPMLRALLRLRHDFVLVGRAAASPLPEALQARLEPHSGVGTAIADFLRASGAALLARRRPPSLDDVESALHSYATAIDAVRQEGLTRYLPSEMTERFFALCFALEQMRHNLRDLHDCVAEWAQSHRHTSDSSGPMTAQVTSVGPV